MRIRFACPASLRAILPPPEPARRASPAWLKDMPAAVEVPDFGSDRTVKQCPPFVDAMTHGFVIGLAADIVVEDGCFRWDWPHTESPMSFHFATQVAGSPFEAGEAFVLKFHNFWTIETEPGWSVLFTHPLNRPDLPFRTLSGLVDTDAYHALPVEFPAVWVDRGFSGVLARGTPIAQGVPVFRARLDLDIAAMDAAAEEAARALKARIKAEPGYYRAHFRQER